MNYKYLIYDLFMLLVMKYFLEINKYINFFSGVKKIY